MTRTLGIKDIIQDYISNVLVWNESDGSLISTDLRIQVNIGGYSGPLGDFLHTIGSSYFEELKHKKKEDCKIYELVFFTNAMAMIEFNEELFNTFPRRPRGHNDFWIDVPMDVVPFVYYFTEQDGFNGSNMFDFNQTKLII